MTPATQAPSRAAAHPRSRIRFFVLIDALGWRYLAKEDFLSELLPYRMPLRTVLGYSSGTIPCILTGMLPAESGYWNLFYHDPQGSPFRWLRPFIGFLPRGVLDHKVSRKALEEIGRHVLGLGPGFCCAVAPSILPHFNWLEKTNIYGHGGIPGVASIFDSLAEKGIRHRIYTYHRWSDEQILSEAARDLKSGEPCFFFLYLCEMDMFLHTHCTDPDAVHRRVCWYADGLRTLLEAALVQDPEAQFTVFSDHGMTPVRARHDLASDIENLGLRSPNDYLAVYDSTMARFWLRSPRAQRMLPDCLNRSVCGRVLRDEELRTLGVFFADRRYGDLVFLLHPGNLFSRSDFDGSMWKPAGMHGYHPDDPWSDAVFLSRRKPGFPLATVRDVHRCMKEAVY